MGELLKAKTSLRSLLPAFLGNILPPGLQDQKLGDPFLFLIPGIKKCSIMKALNSFSNFHFLF